MPERHDGLCSESVAQGKAVEAVEGEVHQVHCESAVEQDDLQSTDDAVAEVGRPPTRAPSSPCSTRSKGSATKPSSPTPTATWQSRMPAPSTLMRRADPSVTPRSPPRKPPVR